MKLFKEYGIRKLVVMDYAEVLAEYWQAVTRVTIDDKLLDWEVISLAQCVKRSDAAERIGTDVDLLESHDLPDGMELKINAVIAELPPVIHNCNPLGDM